MFNYELMMLTKRLDRMSLEAWKLIKPSFLEEFEGYAPELIDWLLANTTSGARLTTVDARIRILCRRTKIKWKQQAAEARKSNPNYGRF